MTSLRPGAVLLLTGEASPQFRSRAMTLRLVSVLPHVTYDGWVWLSGYEIDQRGRAVDKREVYVRRAGLRVIQAAPMSAGPARPPGRRR